MFQPCKPDIENNVCINKTLDSTIEYLGTIPDIYIMENRVRFDLNDFTGKTGIVKES
jgi:hypothetical protein